MKKNIQVFDNVLQLIGNTPLIKLNKMTADYDGEFFAKVEAFNPGHSSKDRIALHIIEEAERNSQIQVYYFNNNEEIVENLSQELRNGDVILVKASNGMKFFEICQKL